MARWIASCGRIVGERDVTMENGKWKMANGQEEASSPSICHFSHLPFAICHRSTFVHPLHRPRVRVARRFVEAAEDHAVELRVGFEKAKRLVRRDRRGAIEREAVHAGADRRERDAADVRAQRERQAVAVARGEQLVLAVLAALPDRADGVDDVLRGEVVALGEPRLAGRAAADRAAFFEQLAARRRGGSRRRRRPRRAAIRSRR